MNENKNKQLYKGLFWFRNLENLDLNDLYFRIPCDLNGNITDEEFYKNEAISKSATTFNHKKLWETLPSKITNNKSYDYYPRGRVEIKNSIAKIFIPLELIEFHFRILVFVKEKFILTKENGIKEVKTCADGSNHYKSKHGVK